MKRPKVDCFQCSAMVYRASGMNCLKFQKRDNDSRSDEQTPE
jgi:hypothetical protein